MSVLKEIFGVNKPIIGMVHLLPLLGAPRYVSLDKVIARAITDAQSLEAGGVDGIIIENISDVPFYPDRVPPETITSMTLVASKIAENVDLKIGINVLRNDAISALAIATAINADFIRVNVLQGTYVTDQGTIQGKAHKVLRYREFLKSNVKIFADICVKYAKPVVKIDPCLEAEELATRGLADVIIVSGEKSGDPPDIDFLKTIRNCSKTPVIIGSGLSFSNLKDFFTIADGAIVGTDFKENGIFTNPVSVKRVKQFMNIVESLR